MKVKIYADILFFIQFTAAYVILDISDSLLQWNSSFYKKIIAALGCAALGMGWLFFTILFPRCSLKIPFVVMILTMLGMIRILSGKKRIRQLLIHFFSVAGIAVFFSGCIFSIQQQTGEVLHIRLLIVLFAVFDFAGKATGAFLHREIAAQKAIWQVELRIQGKTIQTQALYDSGNALVSPYTNQKVAIVSGQLLQKNGVAMDHFILIPYYSLGKEDGLIPAIACEEIVVEQSAEKKQIYSDVMLAVSDRVFLHDQKYDVILHRDMNV